MSTTVEQPVIAPRLRKPKQYTSEFEKNLMIDNLRAAVRIFGKDHLRRGFKAKHGQKV